MMPRPNPHLSRAEPTDAVPTYDARALVADGVQARIILDGQPYVLRITRADKLILTK
nr:hemin uptake protein HemP [Puniceibacterium sediminis]